MTITQQPPPVHDEQGSVAWKDWYFKFQQNFTSLKHNQLNDIQGGDTTGTGEHYHLTELQWEQSRSWRVDSPVTPVTIDPTKKGDIFVLSEDKLTVTIDQALPGFPDQQACLSTVPITGKSYWEVCYRKRVGGSAISADVGTIGTGPADFDVDNRRLGFAPGVESTARFITTQTGGSNDFLYYQGIQDTVLTSKIGFLETCGTATFAADVATGRLWTGKDGVWDNSGDPGAGTGWVNTNLLVGDQYIGCSVIQHFTLDPRIWEFRFAQADFQYTVPTGFEEIQGQRIVTDDSFLVPLQGGESVVLPTGTSWNGRHVAVKKIDDLAAACTVTTAGSDTIDGEASFSLTSPYQAIWLHKRDTVWRIVSQFASSTNILDLSKRYSLLVS